MDTYTERVRRRAYLIWLDEGRPAGREAVHWDMASELVAIEDRQMKTGKPVRRDADKKAKAATRAEPTAPAAAKGKLSAMIDAGGQTYPASRAATRGKTPAPPTTVRAAKAIRAAAAAATGDEVKSPPAKTPSTKTKSTKRGKM